MVRKQRKFPNLLDGKSKVSAQTFLNGEIHDWYRITLGYSDHLVSSLLDEMEIQPGDKVLDPFCGTGTTLIECMKKEFKSVGIDANPSSCFAAKVKTNWSLNVYELMGAMEGVVEAYPIFLEDKKALRLDKTYQYLKNSGMIDRKWISEAPLLKSIAIKSAINSLKVKSSLRNALTLALLAEVVKGASNVKFGPEIYCGKSKKDHNVLRGFQKRINEMKADLGKTSGLTIKKAKVFYGDSRSCDALTMVKKSELFNAIICSPPYPTEHDYTRNARLELAFLEEVRDNESLRVIKRSMIRSHTKGIYQNDSDAKQVANYKAIQSLADILQRKGRLKTDGFSKLYPKVLQEYFGGMKKHLTSVLPYLAPKAKCAYIVGDQSSYLRVHVPTAEILASIANKVGYKVVGIKHWRTRWSSSRSRKINENILLLQKK